MSSSSNWLFEGNDQDLYERLLLQDTDSGDSLRKLESELKQSLQRLQNDYYDSDNDKDDKYWKSLIEQAQYNVGFWMDENDSSVALSSPPSSKNNKSSSDWPAAFQTSQGKAHIEALTSLLHLSSSSEAIQITLGSLSATLTTPSSSSSSSKSTPDNNNLQTLLGTSTLFLSCVEYHGHQRIARLRILMELLRRHGSETDSESGADDIPAASLLTSLDTTHTLQTKNRGLFALLLLASCGNTTSRGGGTGSPPKIPSRQTLQPLIHLLTTYNNHGRTHPTSSYYEASSHHRHPVIQQTLNIINIQTQQERTEALEALLVLWYNYFPSTPTRLDYALWILAITTTSTPIAMTETQDRFAKLAGLISVEGLSLWKTTAPSSEDGSSNHNWVQNHPFFLGLFDTNATKVATAERELKALQQLMEQIVADGMNGTTSSTAITATTTGVTGGGNTTDMIPIMNLNASSSTNNALGITTTNDQSMVPFSSSFTSAKSKPFKEVSSLALLSLGLLQKLAYDGMLETPQQAGAEANEQSDYWYNLDSIGMNNIQYASDTVDAFTILNTIMESLVNKNNDDNSIQVDDDSSATSSANNDTAAIVAYASIGREVLVATVATFADTILHIQHPSAAENIGMLCSLTSVIYRNIPILCQQFWMEWDAYSMTRAEATTNTVTIASVVPGDPLCYLMEAAYSLAISALNAASKLQASSLSPSNSSSTQSTAGLEEALIPNLEPLLALVSCLISNDEDVQSILSTGILPDGMIRTALLCCSGLSLSDQDSPDNGSDGSSIQQHTRGILQSISNLIRMGISVESKYRIAQCLEEVTADQEEHYDSHGHHRPDGPRILYRIITTNDDTIIVKCAFEIMADLLLPSSSSSSSQSGVDDTATEQQQPTLLSLWPLAAARFFVSSQILGEYNNSNTNTTTMDATGSSTTGFAKYVSSSHDDITLAVLKVLNGFVHQLSSVAFHKLPTTNGDTQHQQVQQQQQHYEEIITYMQTIVEGTMVSCRVLSSMLSLSASSNTAAATTTATSGSNFEMAHVVLDTLATLLSSLKPIVTLHASPLVRSTALESQHIMLGLLETQTILGETIGYFALAPISLGFAIDLDHYIREAQLLSLTTSQDITVVGDENANSSTGNKNYGAWKHLAAAKNEKANGGNNNDLSTLVMTHIQGVMSNISSLSLNQTQAICDRGWILPSQECWIDKAACSAMNVLLGWAFTAKDNTTNTASAAAPEVLDPPLASSSSFGPDKLLTSLASLPPPIHDEGILTSFWPKTTLSNLTLLMRYLPTGHDDGGNGCRLPTSKISSLALQVIRVCLGSTTKKEEVKPSLVSMAIDKTKQFYQIVSKSLERAAAASTTTSGALDETIELLQILCTASVTNGQVVRTLLEEDEKESKTHSSTRIIQPMVDTVCDIGSCMIRYSNGGNDSDAAANRIRLGAGCLDVLWALWNVTPPNSTNANHIRKKVIVSGSSGDKFLSAMIQIVMSPTSIQLRQRDGDVYDSSSILPKSVLVNLVSKALDILSVEMVASLPAASSSTGLWGLLKSEMTNNNNLSATSKHCAKLDGALKLSKVWSSFSKELEKISQFSNLSAMNTMIPTDVLLAFPTVSGEMQQTTCHIQGASNFFTDLGGNVNNGFIVHLDASYTLLSKELSLVSAWKKFAQVYTLIMKRCTPSSTLAQDSLALANETLVALYQNVKTTELAHVTINASRRTGNFFAADASHMGCELSELLLHNLHQFVELSSSSSGSGSSMTLPSPTSTDLWTDMLFQLQEASDKLFSTLGQSMVPSSIAAQFSISSPGSLGGKSFNTFCALQHRLLTSATILVTLAENNPPPSTPRSSNNYKQRRNECLVLLARLACKTLTLLEAGKSHQTIQSSEASIKNVTYRELLHSCVSLLTLLVSTNNTGSIIDQEYYSKLASTLRESDAITSLVREAGTASTMAVSALRPYDPSSNAYNHLGGDNAMIMESASEVAIAQQAHDIAVSIVRSIFMLASTITDIGDKSPDMLSLLTNSGFSELIVSNPLLRYASQHWTLSAGQHNAIVGHNGGNSGGGSGIQSPRQLRGYLPADSRSLVGSQKGRQARESGRNCFAGKDDPTHAVWRTAIHILATALRSSSQLLTIQSNTEMLNENFILMALDFLGTHEASLLTCLSETSAVAFGETNDAFSTAKRSSSSPIFSSSVFTKNLLREACNIVTLVSELCTGINRNYFERDSPKLYKRFVQASLEMTGALSNFLGSAGAARELFNAISDMDSSGAEGIPSDINPLLFGGIPNARHEAIRNADFVNSCCAVVTTEDYDASINSAPSSIAGGGGNQAERLEQRCKMIVNSDFILSMEHAAAECLFQSLAVLWKTHPSSSCFVVFTPEEAARLDSMTLVKPQMIIGLRPSINQGRGSFSMVDSATTGVNAISFARVLDSNTVNRQWYVEYLDDPSSRKTEIVGADRLAGVEDVMKRKCVFEYDAAYFVYELAGTSKSKVTLGHLILALRWCHQYMTRPKDDYHSVVKYLAERATALLGTEVALHEEIGTTRKEVGQVSLDLNKRVNAQLLDLFEAVDDRQHYGTSRLGRMKNVIGESTWDAIQKQLSREMSAARSDREKEQQKNAQQTHGMASSGSPYRRGGLFRGVSF